MVPPAEAAFTPWWGDRWGRRVAQVVVGVAIAAWIVMLSRPMMSMPGMSMGRASMGSDMSTPGMGALTAPVWSWADGTAFLLGWGLMMAAMMLPSAAPMIALYGTVTKARTPTTSPSLLTAAFAAPYLLVWTLSGIPVYLAAVGVAAAIDQHPTVHDAVPYAVGAVLVASSAYQLTHLKRACLKSCQSPLSFLVRRWRPGVRGALTTGAWHALFCLGCCAFLMVVLVAAGAMGLAWVLMIAALVALEKLAPPRLHASTLVAGALALLGIAVILAPHLATTLRS